MKILGNIQKLILLGTKIVGCCESNKQTSQVCVFRIIMKPCKPQGRTADPQGALHKRGLSKKCRGRRIR